MTEGANPEPLVRLSFEGNGPMLLETAGPATIRRDGRTERVERATILLCRCGHSGTKPYCDGTHRRAGFVAPPGDLEIASAPDAP
jgi:CDGSH-type Zn-finger protein